MSTASDKTQMTLSEIEDFTDTDQKTLRAYLRRNFKRDDERKGSRWGDAKNAYRLNKTQTKALIEHFSKQEDEQQEKAS